MAAADTPGTGAARAKARGPALLGLALAAGLGVAGFYAAYAGLIPPEWLSAGTNAGDPSEPVSAARPRPGETPRFVPIEPIVVSIGSAGRGRHLRFRAELEVVPGREGAVRALMPRILDVLNGYLRAVPIEELSGPAALAPLRAQMLRRIQLVTGDGAVRDLLVTEFVLN